jgi:hypothetical protein
MSLVSHMETGRPADHVIVLTYAFSGSDYLQEIIPPDSGFSTTYSTGVLPLCDAAAATWRRIDGGGDNLSALATRSIRSLTSQMIAVITAGGGGTRWCETVIAPPDCADLFMRLYPATKLICFHRSFTDFVHVAASEYPWGLADSPFSAFTAAYPNRFAAAIAAYWASYSERLIAFERAHIDHCLRVRYEDLVSRTPEAVKSMLSFLDVQSGETELVAGSRADLGPSERNNSIRIPDGEIPPALRARIRTLCGELGYMAAL